MARVDTLSLLVIAALTSACSAEPITTIDGGSSAADAAAPVDAAIASDAGPPPACGEPDRVCPAELPFTSGPCEGTLHCDAYGSHVADCNDGRWYVQALCDGVPPGGSCLPPMVESCDDPFEGTASGATVAIGPWDADRAFTEDELVEVIFGSQGGAMIRWALRIDGVDAPTCVRAHVRLEMDGDDPYEVAQTMTLHCGDSLATLAILPGSPCEMREYPITIRVAVDGLGESTATLRVMGGLCPRTL